MKPTEREEAYHRGYKQGRFDEYAESMEREQAEKVKAKLEKQKNCVYCHEPFRKMRVVDRLGNDNVWQRYYLFDGSITLAVQQDRGISEINLYLCYPKCCQMCGRPLNEEED